MRFEREREEDGDRDMIQFLLLLFSQFNEYDEEREKGMAWRPHGHPNHLDCKFGSNSISRVLQQSAKFLKVRVSGNLTRCGSLYAM